MMMMTALQRDMIREKCGKQAIKYSITKTRDCTSEKKMDDY